MMDGDCSTDSIRSLATQWTLAGDDKLLNILQNTHKKIVTKCKEVNTKLDEMVSALDDANINLQNVNNKFMALSNSQFIESRVYDDDEVSEEVTLTKEIPTQPQPSQSDMVKRSLSILESMHEAVTILRDSDTESDTDDEDIARLVLKPKDLYRERPLPYIIGTEAWKNKWHAGLLVEDSDTDSDISKPEGHTPEYSESDDDEPVLSSKPDAAVYGKEQVFNRQKTPPKVEMKAEMTPSDMAAELARRLAAQAPQVPETEEEYSPPRPAVKTIYKPQQPTTGIIFSDEPPPLDGYDSDSGQDDIFAELHTSQPYSKNEGLGKSVADDLFGVASERNDNGIFYGADNKISQRDSVPNSSSVANERDSRLAEKPYSNEEVIDKGAKKPVGGISVFGSSKGANSIGAAILKRNLRKQSTSGDESDSREQTSPLTKNTDQTDSVKKEKDILNDLFTKPITHSNKSKGNIGKTSTERLKEDKIKEKKNTETLDLFSDNIFDDIDDIFSSNIVKMPKSDDKINKQSIFDDDVDLFAEVAPSKVSNKVVSSDKVGLFDSDDDDLFGDISPKTDNNSGKTESQNNVQDNFMNLGKSKQSEKKTEDLFNVGSSDITNSKQNNAFETKDTKDYVNISNKFIKETKSIFDSDSDSDIFSSISTSRLKTEEPPKVAKPLKVNVNTPTSNAGSIINANIDENIPKLHPTVRTTETENVLNVHDEEKKSKSPLLFDADDDDLLITVHDNSTSDDVKKVEKNEEPSSVKTNKDAVVGNEGEISSLIPTQEIPKNMIKIRDNISDKLTEDESKMYTEEAVLNMNKPTTVILDKETAEKSHTITEADEKDVKNTNVDSENEVLFPEKHNPTSNKDLFCDILSEPPAFEKPKEPKKSKNVNALFDDDSDDETLFFKRGDVIDEDPENFSSNENRDALFGIFHDEPPDVDVDFTVSDDITDETNPDSDAYLFSSPRNFNENLFNKPVLSTTNIPETPSPTLTKSNDFTENVDIFSTIDSKNIFTLTKDPELPSNKPSFDVVNDFDGLFDTSKENRNLPKEDLDVKKDDLFSTPKKNIKPKNSQEEDLFEIISNKIPNTLQKNCTKDTINVENPKPHDLINSLKPNQKISPVVPAFDDPDEDLFKSSTNVLNPESISTSSPRIDSDLFDSAEEAKTKWNKREENKLDVSKVNNDNDVNHDKSQDVFSKSHSEQSDITKESNDIKKIGKLKNMNFNIDVATLLPGASLTRHNKLQTVTTIQSNEQIFVESDDNNPRNTEPIMIKSISFEGEPNSDVLDNKLSKERAKIQVKRRPSTRRARREAVRKSAIDLEDSTDNSSSIDDIPKNRTDLKSKTVTTESADKRNIEAPQKPTEFHKQHDPKVTKIVYILNDDDIFDNKPKTSHQSIDHLPKNTVGDQKGNLDFTDAIKTTVKAETVKVKKNEGNDREGTTKSLFDNPSDDDEELFNKSNKKIQKPSIFDSDSEEDLFASKKKEVEKKVEVKPSLFGDDDDDENLFAVKNKNTNTKGDIVRPHVSREAIKLTEPVFDDPLSILNDD